MYYVKNLSQRFPLLGSLLFVILMFSSVSAHAAYGYTVLSSSSVQFYVNGAPWADLHYTINGGGQLNVRMTHNSSNNNTFNVTGLASGAVVRYQFTIGGPSADSNVTFSTAWLQLTCCTTSSSSSSSSSSSTSSSSSSTSSSTSSSSSSSSGGRTLVWSDEFNGTGQPNSANWNYHVGNGWNGALAAFQGWGNGEWEWYRPENCTQTGGNLRLQATWHTTPRNVGGRLWYQQSCRLTTQGKKSWTYGRIEARIAAPNNSGAWPAFWMMGNTSGGTNTSSYAPAAGYYDSMATNWASCGEIDIFESMNANNFTINNIFWDLRTGVFPWTAGQNANYEKQPRPAVGDKTQFHVYALEWDATFIRWFVDGTQTHIIDVTPGTLEEFHKPFYILINLALAGTLPNQGPGNPTPQQGEFPLNMYVDYVRVYQ